MRCPYCVSEIDDQALACPHCARDLYLFKPLLAKIAQLEETVERIPALEKELAELKAAQAIAIPEEVQSPPPQRNFGPAVVQAVLPALVLLLAAHGFLLFIYDVKPLYLRLATIFIPVPFGFLLALHCPQQFNKSLLAGLGLALAGVFGMLSITAVIDKVPLMPQELREWRETLEYVVSIALAFATGLLLGKYRAHRNLEAAQKNRFVLLLARAFVPNEEGKLGIEKVAKKLNKLQEAVTPALTGAASIYAGIKALMGDIG
jgi:hypothetical protein